MDVIHYSLSCFAVIHLDGKSKVRERKKTTEKSRCTGEAQSSVFEARS